MGKTIIKENKKMKNIQYLGQSEAFTLFGANGMERLQRVHLSRRTKLFAYGAGMSKQEFVIYDDNMNAVEIAHSKEVDESDLNNYFSATHRVEETVRPISKKFGIGFYYDESGELVPDEIIEMSIERAKNYEKLKEEVKYRKEQEEKQLAEQLKKEYSYLTQIEGYDHKTCGDNIRKELKVKFPRTKFSVRYSSFSGGEDYTISWTDGPTEEEVSDITDKYQDHHSDYSGDYWDYTPSVFNKLFGGVKYVSTNRTISEEAKALVKEEYKDLTRDNMYDYNFKEQDEKAIETARLFTATVEDVIYAICYHRSFEIKATPSIEPVTKVEGTDVEIIDYSEKAFAVVGNTKEIKDNLKRLGGRFNAKLSCGAGWIFSKTKLDEVKEFLKK